MMIAVVAALIAVLSLSLVATAQQQAPSAASRSFSPETVEPGGQVTVTINITNFQLGMAVVETLPDGFTYVSGSLSDGTIEVDGQDLQIIPGSADFTYEVSASDTPGSYPFGGTVRDLDRVSHGYRGFQRNRRSGTNACPNNVECQQVIKS